jgi:two-component system, response regulator RegA
LPHDRLRPGKLRALIVEDERRLRSLLAEMVPELGFEATSVSSAEEALAIMQTDPREIALLDLQLPQMGGLELLDRIRDRWPDTQVVILTAFGDLRSAQHAIRQGVVDFLSKPFHLRDLELAFERAQRRISKPDAIFTEPQESPADFKTLEEAEYRHIVSALERLEGNRTAAAQELGISRRTLHYRLAHYRRRGWQVE